MRRAGGDPALRLNSGGEGPVSAEWFLPKCMWMKENNPEVWESIKTACEYQDFINLKLTGVLVGCTSNAAVRWHCDGDAMVSGSDSGLPTGLWRKCGIEVSWC
jgi:ribulose kinase